MRLAAVVVVVVLVGCIALYSSRYETHPLAAVEHVQSMTAGGDTDSALHGAFFFT